MSLKVSNTANMNVEWPITLKSSSGHFLLPSTEISPLTLEIPFTSVPIRHRLAKQENGITSATRYAHFQGLLLILLRIFNVRFSSCLLVMEARERPHL